MNNMTRLERVVAELPEAERVDVPPDADDERWELLREWIRTSYTLVAPKQLARRVVDEDEAATDASSVESNGSGLHSRRGPS
ncbi:MAG: hypothetical protein R2698_14875 [Microthrixaceae bacterium]